MTNEESIFLDSGLLEQYALDMCNSEENAQVERMLASSHLIRQEYDQIQEGLEVLARSRATRAPMGTKERILAKMDAETAKVYPISETSTGSRNSSLLWKVAAGSALLIGLGLAFRQANESRSLQAEIDRLTESQAAQLAETEALNSTIEGLRSAYSFASDPRTEKIILREDQQYEDLQLVAYWNEEEQKAMLDVASMPAPPPGKCFQLWADVHGEMVSVAVLSTDRTLLQTGAFQAEAESLNITLEDAPGSDHATVSALVTSAAV